MRLLAKFNKSNTTKYMSVNFAKTDIWTKLMSVGSAATIPSIAVPLFMKDANTKSLEKMRAEDKLREAQGLPPLAATGQLLSERLSNKTPTTKRVVNQLDNFSYSTNNTRIINMTPNHILPGELPKNSLG